MPPVLDPINSKVDGLAFLGLSLARNHYFCRGEGKDGEEGENLTDGDNDKAAVDPEGEKLGHPDSYTHQTAFDLNKVIDRDYEFLQSTDDNGWLVGGGEAGPPTSYKLALLDSAHVEIMRVGTYRKDWGGLDRAELLEVMTSGSILIPQIEVLPTDVIENPDRPPELEIRFDMEEATAQSEQILNLEHGNFEAFCRGPLPINWQLRFLHNQFFKTFIFPSRFCPGAFHSTILRKADFRSESHRSAYFAKCSAAIAAWHKDGPKPLNTIPRHLDTRPLTPDEIKASRKAQEIEGGEELEKFDSALGRQNSGDTDFVPPTQEEEEAVAELVDKLAAMAPLPPEATTAKASANLEVSLDEETDDEDEEAEESSRETKTDDESGKKDTPEARNTMAPGEGGDILTADSTTEQKDIEKLYRHTWDDVVRPNTADVGCEKSGTTAEPNEGDEANTETTNSANPEDSNDVQVAAEATSETGAMETTDGEKTEFDEALYSEIAEPSGEAETYSEAATDDALAADSSRNSRSTVAIPRTHTSPVTAPEDCHSGIWLFTDRENITHFFQPNFLPPYDTPEKRKIIFDVLREEWDEKSLSWKPCGHGSMTTKKNEGNVLQKAEELVSGVVSAVMDGVCSPQGSPRKQMPSTLS